MSADPLARYAAIRTSCADEFERELRCIYGARSVALSEPSTLDARGNFAPLRDIALGFGACATQATISFDETDFARLQLPVRGKVMTRSGSRFAVAAAGSAILTSAGQSSAIDYEPDLENLFLRVSSRAIRHRLGLLLDAPVRRAVDFEPTEFSGASMLAGLQRMVGQLVAQLDDEHSQLSSLALAEVEQAVVVQLLFASRHNYSRLLEKDVADPALSHLRLVEAYIEANWNRPILIEALVKVSGVSARTLYKGFEKIYGCSPMMFVKRLRLHRARDLLAKPDDATAVTSVALTCGFLNTGHFARDYRSIFGELPSDTLRRGRRR